MKQKVNKFFNIKLNTNKVFKVKFNKLNKTFKPEFEEVSSQNKIEGEVKG